MIQSLADAAIGFLLFPVVAWLVIIISCILSYVATTSSRWGWATILHAFTVWLSFKYFNIELTVSNGLILAGIYFLLGTVNSLIQWFYVTRTINECANNVINSPYDIIEARGVLTLIQHINANNVSKSLTNHITTSDITSSMIQQACKDLSYDSHYSIQMCYKEILRSIKQHALYHRFEELNYTSNVILRESIRHNSIRLEVVASTDMESFRLSDIKQIFKPVVSVNKDIVVSWIVFWPTLLIWFMISKPVQRVGTAIYGLLGNTYQRITDSQFK